MAFHGTLSPEASTSLPRRPHDVRQIGKSDESWHENWNRFPHMELRDDFVSASRRQFLPSAAVDHVILDDDFLGTLLDE